MTDEKDKKDNVVQGPWGKEPENNGEWIKDGFDKALEKNTTTLKMQEKLSRIDGLAETMMVQMIHTMNEQGYDISNESFILDIGFLSETIKAILSRQEKLPHVVQGLIDSLMTPEETKNEDGVDLHYSRFDTPLLADLVDMAEDIKGEEFNEDDIIFEADTDKISDWKPSDEFKVDKSMNEKRNKKLSKKEEDDDDNGNEF
jgi:hypothetical protein